MTSLRGQVALITGASGIAAATARLFVEQGAQVMVLDKNPENLRILMAELPEIETLEANLLNPNTSTFAVEKALSRFGKLDILVNVAGISGRSYGDGPVHEASDEGWDMVMDTNAKTTFQMPSCATCSLPFHPRHPEQKTAADEVVHQQNQVHPRQETCKRPG
ncbi:SDR family oxidoreductase, partial [Meiothermus sp.]|uniref:SDR family NAD(P)-dependent oxidoreductase n=1 Tax=Meiothermus sp. TaxID=1955249 RepID=UPI00307D1CFB